MPPLARALLVLWMALAIACSPPGEVGEPTSQAAAAVAPTVRPAAEEPLVVFLGDSLTAGLGLDEAQAYPAQLRRLLVDRGRAIRIVNAGVSGDTTAGGLSRIGWLVRQQPDLVVLELGANDGLRGLPPEVSESNLREIIRVCQEAGVGVLLLGMKVPPNYGAGYAERFEALFPRLAADLEVALVPFFLEGVAGNPAMNLADGIHPNPRGHRKAAENLLPALSKLLEELEDRAVRTPPAP